MPVAAALVGGALPRVPPGRPLRSVASGIGTDEPAFCADARAPLGGLAGRTIAKGAVMRGALIAGCQASLVAGVLLIVVGSAGGSSPNLIAPLVYLVGSTIVFGLAGRRAAVNDAGHKVRSACCVALIGPVIPTAITLVAGDMREPFAVQVTLTTLLVWLPTFVGTFAGAGVAAISEDRARVLRRGST